MPYQSRCIGNETQRRLAYHNGTAWLFAYADFIEAKAAYADFSQTAVREALGFLEPLWSHLSENGIGTFAQMKDANYPHIPRGCFADAVTTAKALSLYLRLKYPTAPNNSRIK